MARFEPEDDVEVPRPSVLVLYAVLVVAAAVVAGPFLARRWFPDLDNVSPILQMGFAYAGIGAAVLIVGEQHKLSVWLVVALGFSAFGLLAMLVLHIREGEYVAAAFLCALLVAGYAFFRAVTR